MNRSMRAMILMKPKTTPISPVCNIVNTFRGRINSTYTQNLVGSIDLKIDKSSIPCRR